MTSRIQIFATSHVPLFHPLLAAKQAATIDHITNGRFGLNIVAGWNIDEMGMFGVQQREHDERYAVADEWADIIERLWADEDEFDFDGRFFTMKRAYLQPKPVQRPRPILVNAANSAVGMDFAARRCDFSFQGGLEVEELKKVNDRMRAHAAEHGRHIGILSTGVVVCADTEREAQRFFTRYVDELGDFEAARNIVDGMLEGMNAGVREGRSPLPEAVIDRIDPGDGRRLGRDSARRDAGADRREARADQRRRHRRSRLELVALRERDRPVQRADSPADGGGRAA